MSYIDYLVEHVGLPSTVAIGLVILFLLAQVIGEIAEIKGKVVPEVLNMRKYFKRKKAEREALSKMPALIESFEQVPETLKEVKTLLNDVNQHYSSDNIAKRDGWIKEVNEHIADSEIKRCEQNALMAELSKKLDENNAMTLSISIENKRNAIINFASYVAEDKNPVTREQYKRIFKTYEDYEEEIERHGLTNGEVEIAIRIIRESYERHLRQHSFIEDLRGYDILN